MVFLNKALHKLANYPASDFGLSVMVTCTNRQCHQAETEQS